MDRRDTPQDDSPLLTLSASKSMDSTTYEKEEQVERRSYAADDEDEEEEEEEDEEDYESDTDNLSSDWKQHALAVLVALGAALYYHFCYNIEPLQGQPALARRTTTTRTIPSYRRLQNVSFCEPETIISITQDTPSLERFDFYVPSSLLPVLENYYRQDNERQISNDDDSQHHQEYQCLLNQGKKLLQGYSVAYPQPSLENMLQRNDDNNNDQPLSVMALHKQQSKLHKKTATPVSLSFTGFCVKFVNLSPKPVLLHWEHRGGDAQLVAELAPYEAVGTATLPGSSFYVSPILDASHALQRWTATSDEPLLYYEPDDAASLTVAQTLQRDQQVLNRHYAQHYFVQTQRAWLAHFPRPPPRHKLWPCNYFGHTHTITTRALESPLSRGNNEEKDERRTTSSLETPTLNQEVMHALSKDLDLRALSVAPRAFEIPNFLSRDECLYLMQAATTQGLERSHVVTSSQRSARYQGRTRSSQTAWIPREHSHAVDVIYRRAADVLGMDEALLRHQNGGDPADHEASIAESLQVVRYQENQEYTAHHDFVFPSASDPFQPTRFATLLVYLNDDFEGGETQFPRAVNDKNHDGLIVQPQQGKAVLFYNMLPDGNMDDLSQHSALPVKQGEKWLATLWVWDPIIG